MLRELPYWLQVPIYLWPVTLVLFVVIGVQLLTS
jgi:hypothetical protein